MTDTESLLTSTADRVLHLRLNRPDRRNALSAELRQRIVDSLVAAAGDDGIGAVLITGAGDTFCAGFDLAELAAAPDPAAVFTDAQRYHRVVHTFPKPIVAAVNGPALAGGFDLALMCDVRIASGNATFGQPQVRRGIPASYELTAHVLGVAVARELCLTGRVVDAAEAKALGIVTTVVDRDSLSDAAATLASTIAGHAGSARTKARFIDEQPAVFGRD
jgi:enoyl-CoA hydratase